MQHVAERHARTQRRLNAVHKIVVRFPMGERALVHRAARARGMRVQESLRRTATLAATETLTEPRFELDPFSRRSPGSGTYPEPLPSGRKA